MTEEKGIDIVGAMQEREALIEKIQQRPFLICRHCFYWENLEKNDEPIQLDLIGYPLRSGYCKLVAPNIDLSGVDLSDLKYRKKIPKEAYRWSDDYACMLGTPTQHEDEEPIKRLLENTRRNDLKDFHKFVEYYKEWRAWAKPMMETMESEQVQQTLAALGVEIGDGEKVGGQ